MSVKLKLVPFSSSIEKTNNISFNISNLDKDKEYRINFENLSLNNDIIIKECQGCDILDGKYLLIKNSEIVNGKIDLNLNKSLNISVVSIYANIEEKNNNIWSLKYIVPFNFQIETLSNEISSDKISSDKIFFGINDKVKIFTESEPNSILNIFINGRKFIVKSGFDGNGTLSVRGYDIIGSDDIINNNSLQRFNISYSKNNDNFNKIYKSNLFVNFIPEQMSVLQVAGNIGEPECAIIDPDPSQVSEVNSIKDFCFNGAVVGDLTIFNDESDYINSNVGYCSQISNLKNNNNQADFCRLYDNLSSTLLPDGNSLVAFSSQISESGSCNSGVDLSRIFVFNSSSSAKNRTNPVRNATIIGQPLYYHTATLDNISINDTLSVLIRIDDEIFDIQHKIISESSYDSLFSLKDKIENDSRIIPYGIKCSIKNNKINIFSNNDFIIDSLVYGDGNTTLVTKLNSNTTLELMLDANSVNDIGNTVVFLYPNDVGSFSYPIVSRNYSNNTIFVKIKDGINNGVGPDITENLYCKKIVITDLSKENSIPNFSTLNPLPYIKDENGKNTISVRPQISSRKDYKNGKTYVYIVAQGLINNIYQLFFYSFYFDEESLVKMDSWIQLTSDGENKNAKITNDVYGNLHIVWESDRSGITKIYYGCMGSSSKPTNNQVFVSMVDKYAEGSFDESFNNISLLEINDTENIQRSPEQWYRAIHNNGLVSVVDFDNIAVQGNPNKDSCLGIFPLNKDNNDVAFDGTFSQLSFQIDFNYKINSEIFNDLKSDYDINVLYKEWMSQFIVNENKFRKNDNLYSIGKVEKYLDGFIPIVGSYEIGGNLLPSKNFSSFLTTEEVKKDNIGRYVPGYENNQEYDKYLYLTKNFSIGYNDVVNHFVLGLVPECYRFKATNIESYSQFCNRILNNLNKECTRDDYIAYLEENGFTGKFKLALFLSTSESDENNYNSNKKFKFLRFIGDYISFKDNSGNQIPQKFNIGLHYCKAPLDHINDRLTEKYSEVEQDFRFNADIVIAINDQIVASENFIVDMASQYRQFDIGFGFLPNSQMIVNEFLPFYGSIYSDNNILAEYSNISIGPYNFTYGNDVFLSSYDRNTSSMIVPGVVNTSLISNGDFELSTINPGTALDLTNGSEQIDNWVVFNGGVRYIGTEFDASSNQRSVELKGTSGKGGILQQFQTVPGKEYVVYFDINKNPNTTNTQEILLVSAAGSSATYTYNSSSSGWISRQFNFTANSEITTLSFQSESVSPLNSGGSVVNNALPDLGLPDLALVESFESSNEFTDYGPVIDNVSVLLKSNIVDELSSTYSYEELKLSENQFDLTYSLSSGSGFSQVPLCLDNDYIDKNPDIDSDSIGKIGITWQSNRNGFWDIYYSGMDNKSLPFRFDTRITDKESESILPSIGIDDSGRKLIAWHDNRNSGKNNRYQIYSAIYKDEDLNIISKCELDKTNFAKKEIDDSIDPYDPYLTETDILPCEISFSFTSQYNDYYHFKLQFYSDKDKTNLIKEIQSDSDISGWRHNYNQFPYSGLYINSKESVNITYNISDDDDLSGSYYYMSILYKGKEDVEYTEDSNNNFIFYCPFNQKKKCNIICSYANDSNTSKKVHFRVNFFSDPTMNNLVFSSFSLLNYDNWKTGFNRELQEDVISNSIFNNNDAPINTPIYFPVEGLSVLPGESINVSYNPDVVPFEIYNLNKKSNCLICGINYYVSIETFIDNKFTQEETLIFNCPCFDYDSDIWRKDIYSQNWICSGQGKDDIRITLTDDNAFNAKVCFAKNDLFYIIWQDYRYSKSLSGQPYVSPDYFAAIYDISKDKMLSSGQGGYDRRLTYFSDDSISEEINSKILYGFDFVVDNFQNLVTYFHNGFDLFYKKCSFGCSFERIVQDTPVTKRLPSTISNNISGRDSLQYRQIRVAKNSILFSTYKDSSNPISVVDSCFINLDVIGVPGTIAFRLKNENDEEWTNWIPIGPDLSSNESENKIEENKIFRAYFIDKERFIAPWVLSSGNGVKNVCCEVLSYFGKSTQFCVDVMALYSNMDYEIDFFFDSEFQNQVPVFNGFPVVSQNKIESGLKSDDLSSINKDVQKVDKIYIRLKFKDNILLNNINEIKSIDRFSDLGDITVDIIQQGLNDQYGITMSKVDDLTYSGVFDIQQSDGIINEDGLAYVVVNIPGQCNNSISFNDSIINYSLQPQDVSILDDLTVFRERYNKDDIRNSFGNTDLYKFNKF